ncbi:MAG: RagB/SusD family nutrient uptake outer membrane protein [Dinghuibacter sp.]|nr:RagB/SusD family nutrient uptake outer membrane protein [Dinghuibacter sp.]
MFKTNKITGIVAGAVLMLGACKKLDDIKPEGLVDPSVAITSETNVREVLISGYLSLASGNFYGGRLQVVSELMADKADGSGLLGYDADIYNLRSNSDAGTAEIYREPYRAIQRANLTLENLDKVGAANKARFEGEALFLRAVGHFELVRIFAQPYGYTSANTHPGIVVRTNSAFNNNAARNSVAEVYTQVVNDLNAAAALLPAANGVFASRWAAKGYLAKVFFQMNKFDSAYKHASDVITGSGATFDNTAAFVTNRFGVTATTENVFGLVQDAVSGARFGTLRGAIDATTIANLGLPLTTAAYNEGFVSNDKRSAWYWENLGIKRLKKYFAERLTLPLVYITEMKLIRAESAAELNQNLATAIGDINDIINRAYTVPAPLPGGATANIVLAKVREQRKLELVYELGDRLQQIKRIGAKGEASFSRTAPWNCNGLILQFPAADVSVNPNFQPNPQGGCL